MKMTFTGCGNRGQKHSCSFRPWHGTCYLGSNGHFSRDKNGQAGYPGEPAHWLFGRFLPGKLEGLQLGGWNYEVTLEFEEAELKNWLKNYIKHKPDEALDLLTEMLPEAVAKLKEKGKEEG